MQRLGEAWQRAGATDKAHRLLRRAWMEGNFTRREERALYKRHRRLLRQAEHAARLDRLLWEGRRLAAGRMLARVDPATRRLAVARIKVMSFAAGVAPPGSGSPRARSSSSLRRSLRCSIWRPWPP